MVNKLYGKGVKSMSTRAICRHCKSSENVEQTLKDLAKEIQKINKKVILNVDKKEEISKLSGVSILEKSLGVETMTFKEAVPLEKRGEVDYMKCSNEEHLKDLNLGSEKEFAVHKYYFTCPHYEEVE